MRHHLNVQIKNVRPECAILTAFYGNFSKWPGIYRADIHSYTRWNECGNFIFDIWSVLHVFVVSALCLFSHCANLNRAFFPTLLP